MKSNPIDRVTKGMSPDTVLSCLIETAGYTKEQFWQLARLQRGEPEIAMEKAQMVMGGGVMSVAIEHTGDLIHRMCEKTMFRTAGYEFVEDKVDKVLRYLNSPYGFEREFKENLASNARFHNKPLQKHMLEVDRALDAYRRAHLALPTYNQAHRKAQMAAVCLGEKDFSSARLQLSILQKHLKDVNTWVAFAHEGLIE